MFGGATLVSAQQDQTSTQTQESQSMQDQDKQQITVSELPEAVTAKLESQDYSGWTVGNAYKKTDESNQEIYIVEMKQGTETKKVKFDKEGNQIEKGKHDKSESSNYRDDTQSDDAQSSDQSEDIQSTEQSTEQADKSSTEQQ